MSGWPLECWSPEPFSRTAHREIRYATVFKSAILQRCDSEYERGAIGQRHHTVYNGAKFLGVHQKCNQTFRNFEYLIVNNAHGCTLDIAMSTAGG